MLYQNTLRFFCFVYVVLLKFVSWIRKNKVPKREKLEVLMTGTFYSDNWLITHLKPIAMSDHVAVVYMVSVREVPAIDKVVGLYPPNWLQKTL